MRTGAPSVDGGQLVAPAGNLLQVRGSSSTSLHLVVNVDIWSPGVGDRPYLQYQQLILIDNLLYSPGFESC